MDTLATGVCEFFLATKKFAIRLFRGINSFAYKWTLSFKGTFKKFITSDNNTRGDTDLTDRRGTAAEGSKPRPYGGLTNTKFDTL